MCDLGNIIDFAHQNWVSCCIDHTKGDPYIGTVSLPFSNQQFAATHITGALLPWIVGLWLIVLLS